VTWSEALRYPRTAVGAAARHDPLWKYAKSAARLEVRMHRRSDTAARAPFALPATVDLRGAGTDTRHLRSDALASRCPSGGIVRSFMTCAKDGHHQTWKLPIVGLDGHQAVAKIPGAVLRDHAICCCRKTGDTFVVAIAIRVCGGCAVTVSSAVTCTYAVTVELCRPAQLHPCYLSDARRYRIAFFDPRPIRSAPMSLT